ncbi:unnamed protein product [Gadus morhua 'NCC']
MEAPRCTSSYVNRYKLHLAAVKSLVPEKLHRTANLNEETDPRFCDPTGERNTHPSLTKNYSKTDQRSAGGRRRPEAPSVLPSGWEVFGLRPRRRLRPPAQPR